MSLQNFVDYSQQTPITAAWLNAVGQSVAQQVAVQNVAQLRTLPSSNYSGALTQGYYSPGDGGGASFYVNPNDTTSADNGGSIIVAADGARWYQDPKGGQFNVKSFGCKLNSTVDDAAPLQAAETAASAAGVNLFFPAFSYLGSWVQKSSGVSWYGTGKTKSGVKALASFTSASPIVNGANIANCGLYNLGFDYSAAPFHPFMRNVFFTTFTNGEIVGCDFVQQAIGFQCDGGTRFSIRNNSFEQLTAFGTTINEGIWITANTSPPSNYEICNNVLRNVGTDFTGAAVLISQNNIQGWAYGAGITIEQNQFNYTVIGNVCSNSVSALDGNGVPPPGIECWANQSIVANNICNNNAGCGISAGGGASVYDSNTCLNNGTYSGAGNVPRYRTGIIARFVDANINVGTSVISNNTCLDEGSGTQLFGYTDDGVGVAGVTLANNIFFGVQAPMSATGGRYDFKGPKLVSQATGQPGVTVASGAQVVGNAGFAVSGAMLGDQVTVGVVSQNMAGMQVVGWVVATGVVAWSFSNLSGAPVTIAAYTANICVEKPFNYANY